MDSRAEMRVSESDLRVFRSDSTVLLMPADAALDSCVCWVSMYQDTNTLIKKAYLGNKIIKCSHNNVGQGFRLIYDAFAVSIVKGA